MALIVEMLSNPDLSELLTNLVKCIGEKMPELVTPYADIWSNHLNNSIGTQSENVFNLAQVLHYISNSKACCN